MSLSEEYWPFYQLSLLQYKWYVDLKNLLKVENSFVLDLFFSEKSREKNSEVIYKAFLENFSRQKKIIMTHLRQICMGTIVLTLLGLSLSLPLIQAYTNVPSYCKLSLLYRVAQ